MNNKANTFLRASVARKYELVNWTGGHKQVFGPFGEVDLKTLTLAKAEALVKSGFTKLIAKSKDSSPNNSDE